MFDKHLVHALIGGKDLDCGSAKLSVNPRWTSYVWTIYGWTRGHGSLLRPLDNEGAPCLAVFARHGKYET
jgi:hypothetical protein